jgi:hypothetical protein
MARAQQLGRRDVGADVADREDERRRGEKVRVDVRRHARARAGEQHGDDGEERPVTSGNDFIRCPFR